MSTLRELVKLDLFEEFNDDELYSLSKMVAITHIPADTIICNEGDQGNEMYILLSGCVDVFKDIGSDSEVLARLGQGEMFGEMSILDDTTRNACVKSVEASSALIFGKESLHLFLNENLNVAYRFFLLLGKCVNRRLRLLNLNFLFSQLTLEKLSEVNISQNLGWAYSPVSFFDLLDNDDLDFLKGIGSVKEYATDEIVVDENEVARDLFLVLEGAIKIIKLLPMGEEVQLVELRKGNLFGEMSFLDDGFRSARVKTNAATKLLALNRQCIERNRKKDMLAVCKLFLVALQNISHNIRLTTEIYNKARSAAN